MIEPKVCCTKLAFKLMCHLCLDLDFVLQTVAVKQGSEPDYTAMQCPVPLLPAACCGACTACIRCAASLLCYLALLAVSLSFCLAE